MYVWEQACMFTEGMTLKEDVNNVVNRVANIFSSVIM
jgi:hypothetical protein